MRVVLREDVDHLGHKGDLLEVADGYARNFLVPRGLAMKATKGVVAQANAMRRSRSARGARPVRGRGDRVAPRCGDDPTQRPRWGGRQALRLRDQH